MMIDTVRGVLRVRKWPRKYGKPRSALQAYWVDWFKQANLLAKYADAMSQRRAIEMTKGSGLYPRDVLLKAMRGRLYWWIDDTGWKWFPMAGISDISGALEVLGQTIGDVLVRATDRWRPALEGAAGKVLTHQGPAAAPKWVVAGAGGVVQVELTESPISPDGSVSEYNFDVTNYSEVEFTLDGLGFAVSGALQVRLSTDGGVSYKAGASDYRSSRMTAVVEYNADRSTFLFFDIGALTDHNGTCRLSNLRAGRAVQCGYVGTAGGTSILNGFANFDGPITHVKLFAGGSQLLDAGTIRAVGIVAA